MAVLGSANVKLSDGTTIKASDITVGTSINTFDYTALCSVDVLVSGVEVLPSAETLKISFEDKDFICSKDHEFFRTHKDDYLLPDWVRADRLTVGEVLYGGTVIAITPDTPADLVKIVVSDSLTYICDGVLSYNAGLHTP